MTVKSTAIHIAKENDGVIGLKLKSGEMIISTLVTTDESASMQAAPWSLLFPMLALMGENITLIPWLISGKNEQEFSVDLSDSAICAFKIPEEIRNSYLSMTGQKKILAPAGKILVTG